MDQQQQQQQQQQQNTFVGVTHPSKLLKWKNMFISVAKFIYNPETNECIGRDGLSWAKISLCYMFFYAGLGTFFVGMLAVFISTLSMSHPTYFSDRSTMASGSQINPGLGYRPQIDPEDTLIAYDRRNLSSDVESKLIRLNRSLTIYLREKYDKNRIKGIEDCSNVSLSELRDDLFKQGYFCNYEHQLVLESTSCEPKNTFGYLQDGPCVALKLNKIYNWLPLGYNNLKEVSEEIKDEMGEINENIFNGDEEKMSQFLSSNVFVKCFGEYANDKDNLEQLDLIYFSVNSKSTGISNIGMLPVYYYPYLNQKGYESPLVFIQFKSFSKYQLLNVICKSFAKNIDSLDKLNLRGMTLFQLYYHPD